MPTPTPLFDASLEPSGLTDGDVGQLVHFGVRAGLASSPEGPRPGDGAELVARWEALLDRELPRLERLGVTAFALLGAAPDALPARGFPSALHALAQLLGRRRAVAVGPVSLGSGDPALEHAFLRQLEVAQEVNRPLVARLGGASPRAALTRLFDVLEEGGADPSRVLILGAGRTAFRLLRERGYAVALRPLSHRLTAAAAADLVNRHGSEGVLLASGAGSGHADLLAVPKMAAALEERGLPPSVARRVGFQNAAAFFRFDPAAM
ncbi:MAG TPA: hypothetical protein VMB50_00595 [Myxococcales bacterium]|nr:hypothetical protein [Myxococcales bacterium]